MVQALVNTSGSSVPGEEVDSLASAVKGRVLRDGDPSYDEARTVFNGMIDRRPGLIVQPANSADVAAAVKFARERNLLVSVKCGGHSGSGYAVV